MLKTCEVRGYCIRLDAPHMPPVTAQYKRLYYTPAPYTKETMAECHAAVFSSPEGATSVRNSLKSEYWRAWAQIVPVYNSHIEGCHHGRS